MTISELVAKLSVLRALHGDLEVKLPQSVVQDGVEHTWNAKISHVDVNDFDEEEAFVEIL